jgi:hypothetical protein
MLNSCIPSKTTRNKLTHTIKISRYHGNKLTTKHRNIVIGEIYSRSLKHLYLMFTFNNARCSTAPSARTRTWHTIHTLYRLSVYLREKKVSITRHYAARSYTYVALLYKQCYFCPVLTKQSFFTTALRTRSPPPPKKKDSVCSYCWPRLYEWTPPTFRNASINCIFIYLQKIKSWCLRYRSPSTQQRKGPRVPSCCRTQS